MDLGLAGGGSGHEDESYVQLDEKALELTQGRILTGPDAGERHQGSHVAQDVAPDGIEDQAVDGFAEGGEGQEGDHDKGTSQDTEDGAEALGDLERIVLTYGQTGGHDATLGAGRGWWERSAAARPARGLSWGGGRICRRN